MEGLRFVVNHTAILVFEIFRNRPGITMPCSGNNHRCHGNWIGLLCGRTDFKLSAIATNSEETVNILLLVAIGGIFLLNACIKQHLNANKPSWSYLSAQFETHILRDLCELWMPAQHPVCCHLAAAKAAQSFVNQALKLHGVVSCNCIIDLLFTNPVCAPNYSLANVWQCLINTIFSLIKLLWQTTMWNSKTHKANSKTELLTGEQQRDVVVTVTTISNQGVWFKEVSRISFASISHHRFGGGRIWKESSFTRLTQKDKLTHPQTL